MTVIFQEFSSIQVYLFSDFHNIIWLVNMYSVKQTQGTWAVITTCARNDYNIKMII